MSKLREQLIQIQRKNYLKNLKLLKESLELNPNIQTYEKEYYRYLNDYQEISNKNELIRKVLAANLVFHGDYHTLRQSQRSILRVLREIQAKRQLILCLEMIHSRDQKLIDQFIAGRLSERTFLNKIEYAKTWPYRWRNWGPILRFCRQCKIPIVGINTAGNKERTGVHERDQHAARIIAKTRIRYPEKLIYIVDGDFHVSPGHLPQETQNLLELLDIPTKRVIIYQNAENLYWRLCREGKEESDVLKIDENSYCIMNTMPANKVQSYLNWLEYSDDAYYPVHRNWQDDTFEGMGLTVEAMVSTICAVLDLKIPNDALQRLHIHYANDLYFMDFIHNTPELKVKIRSIKDKIKREEGFLLEYGATGKSTYLIYLPNSSINMAAEEASHFINAVLRGRLQGSLSSFDRFYRNVITECLGFFGSKFINEKRKSHSENSLRRLLGQIKRGEYRPTDPLIPTVARLILQHFYLQRKATSADEFRDKFDAQYINRSALPTIFSTQLGYILGNKLYYTVKNGTFPIAKVRNFFTDPFDHPEHAFQSYLDISQRLKQVKTVNQF